MLRFSPSRGAAALVLNSLVRGPQGAAATITIGTVSALAEGSTPTVANSGTTAAAVFDFGIPRGAISAIGFNFDTSTTDADPGAGDVRFNNATPASVTAIYFDNVDRDGNTVTTWLDSFDDSTSTLKGYLVITPAATQSAKLIYSVSGSVVDGTGYRKVTVASVAGTTLPSSGAHLGFEFIRTGDSGTGTFPGSSTDNAVVRFDGAGGATVQNSGVTIDDSANVGGVAALSATTIELGHASDTTISRTGAGVIAVEGVDVSLNSISAVHTASTIELGNASDTTLSRSSAGVLAVEGVTVALNSTSATHTAGTIELGAATDTTISRSSAGVIAVEGVTVPLNSTSSVHTASSIELGAATDTTISRASAGVIAVEGVSLYPNIPITSKSAAYTTVLGDANTCIYHPSSDNNARTFTIDSNANVAYPVGTFLVFVNEINTVTIAITTDTLTQAGTGSTGSRTLAANGAATALKVASTKWVISGSGLT